MRGAVANRLRLTKNHVCERTQRAAACRQILANLAAPGEQAGPVLPPQHLLLDSSTASAGPRELAACKTLARKQANFAGPARYEIATIPPTNRALTSQYCCGTGREP